MVNVHKYNKIITCSFVKGTMSILLSILRGLTRAEIVYKISKSNFCLLFLTSWLISPDFWYHDWFLISMHSVLISDFFTDFTYFPSYFPEDFHQPQWMTPQLWLPAIILSRLAIAQYIAVAKSACEGNCNHLSPAPSVISVKESVNVTVD